MMMTMMIFTVESDDDDAVFAIGRRCFCNRNAWAECETHRLKCETHSRNAHTDKHRRLRSIAGMRAHVSQISQSSSSARSSARNC